MLTGVLRRLRRLVRSDHNEAGQALLFVLIALALLMSIPLAIATTTINQLPETTRNLNWDAAYEAAQAGLNDYEQRLDANGSYSVCSKTYTTGCGTNAALTGWVQASTTPLEYYSYAPTVQSGAGLVQLDVSGKAGTGADAVVRTFAYTVKPASSLDDVYWTNYETLDPTIPNLSSTGCSSSYTPSYYNPSGSGNPPSSCTVEFDSQDTLTGPVFSNDAFRTCGATFQGTVESGDSNTTTGYTNGNGCSSPGSGVFLPGNPTVVSSTPPQSSIPTTTTAAALSYGCSFTGNVTLALSLYPTTSPTTTRITWSGGTLATGSKSFCTSPITLSSMTAGLIYAPGTITVQGNMMGLLDIVSGSNIILSGSVEYGTSGSTTDSTDALGLVATTWVQMGQTGSPINNLTVDAAILALKDSFYLPNWNSVSAQGTLTVYGSIAQNFRGPVGAGTASTVTNGYAKNYVYDTALQTLWPPYFVPPTDAAWGPTTYEECQAGNSQSVLNTPNC